MKNWNVLELFGEARPSKAAREKPKLIEVLGDRKPALQDEWSRITRIPRIDIEKIDTSCIEWLHKDREKAELRPIQKRALASLSKYGGLFGPLGVGCGKTLIAWLAPLVIGNPRTVIMMPPSMVEAFQEEIEKWRDYFEVPDPEPIILPYSILSSARGTSILNELNPEMIIGDEAHALMRPNSARTRRFKRYRAEHPHTVCLMLSGTFFDKTPSDLAHIVQFSLGSNAFMPVRGRALEIWGQCVNLDGQPNESDWRSFSPLALAEGVDLEHFTGDRRTRAARTSVYVRMRDTPGVVTTIAPSIELPIHIYTHEIEIPSEIEEALDSVLSDEETPDGEDIITDAAHKARLQDHLSAGFYYRWAWEEIGGRDEEWLLARKGWNRALRRELDSYSREGYDSEKLVRDVVREEYRVNPRLANVRNLHYAWSEWEEHWTKKPPPSRAVWVSDFYIEWIKNFLSDGVPTVVWYKSLGMETALREFLPVHGAGSDVPVYDRQSVACASKVHGEGKNGFQPWWRCLVVEPFSRTKTWEQLIGRHHRPGQEHDFVEVHVPIHTERFRKCLDDSVRSAYHTKDLSMMDQRLLLADYREG